MPDSFYEAQVHEMLDSSSNTSQPAEIYGSGHGFFRSHEPSTTQASRLGLPSVLQLPESSASRNTDRYLSVAIDVNKHDHSHSSGMTETRVVAECEYATPFEHRDLGIMSAPSTSHVRPHQAYDEAHLVAISRGVETTNSLSMLHNQRMPN